MRLVMQVPGMVRKAGSPWRSSMMQEEAPELMLSSSDGSLSLRSAGQDSKLRPLDPQDCVSALTCEDRAKLRLLETLPAAHVAAVAVILVHKWSTETLRCNDAVTLGAGHA
jgi:hypothetical protein